MNPEPKEPMDVELELAAFVNKWIQQRSELQICDIQSLLPDEKWINNFFHKTDEKGEPTETTKIQREAAKEMTIMFYAIISNCVNKIIVRRHITKHPQDHDREIFLILKNAPDGKYKTDSIVRNMRCVEFATFEYVLDSVRWLMDNKHFTNADICITFAPDWKTFRKETFIKNTI